MIKSYHYVLYNLFPRCSKWISNCGREEFRYLTPRELSEKKVCEFHFDDGMFSNPMKVTLLKQAVPKAWKSTPELIEIDEGSDSECESGIVSEESTTAVTHDNIISVNEEVLSTNRSILVSALTNGNDHVIYKKKTDQNHHKSFNNNSQSGSAENPSSNAKKKVRIPEIVVESILNILPILHFNRVLIKMLNPKLVVIVVFILNK